MKQLSAPSCLRDTQRPGSRPSADPAATQVSDSQPPKLRKKCLLSMSHPDSGIFILQPGMGCAEVVQGPSGAMVDAWAAPGEGSAVSTSGGVLSPPGSTEGEGRPLGKRKSGDNPHVRWRQAWWWQRHVVG